LGHIINQTFPNSSRATTVQRKDIDGFYGSVFEVDFQNCIMGRRLTLIERLAHRDAKFRPKIYYGDERVEFYLPKGKVPDYHSKVIFHDNSGKIVVAVKKSKDSILAADESKWKIVQSVDYRLPALVSLMKAAYLTMFRLIGYPYALSAAGIHLGYTALGRFFLECEGQIDVGKKKARGYFQPYMNMIRPIEGFTGEPTRGTIEDGKVGLCLQGDEVWGVVVYLRIDSMFHGALIPCFCNANSGVMYERFLANDVEELRILKGRFNQEKGQFEVLPKHHAMVAHWPKGPRNFNLSD
jgi:hypothetical protein